MATFLIDAHFHLDLYPDPAQVLTTIEVAKVYTIAVTKSPTVFRYTANLVSTSKYVRAAVGLHPELVSSRAGELKMILPLLETTRYAGEVGLDYASGNKSNHATQRAIFTAILERCAALGNRVITIHSRRAVKDVLAAAGEAFPGKLILHWFSGSVGELKQAAERGFYFSVNFAMIKSKAGQRLIASMPNDRVLTEMDGPFVSLGSRPALPPDTSIVVNYLADCWKLERLQAAERIRATFHQMLRMNSDGGVTRHLRCF